MYPHTTEILHVRDVEASGLKIVYCIITLRGGRGRSLPFSALT